MGERVTVEELRKQKAEIYSIGEWIAYNCDHVPPDLLAGLRNAAQIIDRAADTIAALERERDEALAEIARRDEADERLRQKMIESARASLAETSHD